MTTGGGGNTRKRVDGQPRPPADARPTPPSAPRTSAILSAEELAVLNAGLAARQARAQHLQQRSADVAAHRARREAEDLRRAQQRRDDEDRAKLQGRPPGPNLPAHLRRTPRLFVQEEDLEDLIPDGWGLTWRDDAERLAGRTGLPAVGVQLLTLLEWLHGLRAAAGRSPHGTGGGLQASPEWLARKLGCSKRWIQKLLNQLDPWAAWRREAAHTRLRNHDRARRGLQPLPLPQRPAGGAVYLQRFPQLRRYSTLTSGLPPDQRMARWVCRDGRLHEWVDLTGVLYVTATGCRVLRRRARRDAKPRPGQTPQLRRSPMQRDLYRRLKPIYRRLRARLAPALQSEFTPNNVKPYVRTSIPGTPSPSVWDDTGPPPRAGPGKGRSAHGPGAEGANVEAQAASHALRPPELSALPVGGPASGRAGSLAEEMARRLAELEAMGYRKV